MKQVLQDIKTGKTKVVDVPCPKTKKGYLLVQTEVSLISPGTERMLVEFGKANYMEKARQHPEKVKQVLDKVKTDGLVSTIDAVRSKLDQPLPLGYCNVGVVLESGSDGFKAGNRVASNGNHAEVVCVPKNLCAKIPDNVDDDSASFVVLAAIGLQGLRLAKPELGEYFVVCGLGLIGLLTVQLLRAHGCRVLGIDFDESKLELAKKFGADTINLNRDENPVNTGITFSRGKGIDGVIITASSKSSEPVSQAARMCRKRGRIVLVGVTGLEINRSDFYEKELSFQVSCSYGPGRYDSEYEEQGHDYPVGFVRWTEQRNFEAVLDMMSEGHLDVKPLISHRYVFEKAKEAYNLLSTGNSCLGILLEYPKPSEKLAITEIVLTTTQPRAESGLPVCGFIGAGNYASRILIPAFKKTGAQLHTIVSNGGVSSVHHGKKNGFAVASSAEESVLTNNLINTVVIVTRHNTHADYVVKALKAGKHIFVEKPLCLTIEELNEIEELYSSLLTSHPSPPLLMVGFNRRFSPLVAKMKEMLSAVKQPKSFIMTVNAGEIPPNHWTQDLHVGGGRIIGEACHFIDLLRFLTDSPIKAVKTVMIGKDQSQLVCNDNASISLEFMDGSFGTVHYLANGSQQFPKERLEVFCSGKVLQLDNFRRLKGYGWPGFNKMKLWHQDKGQKACAAFFVDAIKKGERSPIPFEQLIEVSRVTIEINKQLV